MYSDADLDSAVGAGALSADAAASFRGFISRQRSLPAADEEHFRLLTGFNDIFVSIAVLVLLFALNWLAKSIGPVWGGVAVAVVSWGLAEYFTKRRRMALPSILLLISFAMSVFAAVAIILAPEGGITTSWRIGASAAVTVVAVYGHWRRFMVPITPAIGSLALLGALVALIVALVPALKEALPILFLLGGIGVFAWAMWWDMSDPARTTRRSDVAFWLHLAAAPMMVHPVFALLGLSGFGALFAFNAVTPGIGLGAAAIAVGIYLGLACIALAIDRRALLVSALAYVLYAIATLFQAAGSLTFSLALTGLVIGSGLLLLSAFWHGARVLVIKGLPQAFRARLPAI